MTAQDWSIIVLFALCMVVVGFDRARQEFIAEWRRSLYAKACSELLTIAGLPPSQMGMLFESGRHISEAGLRAVRDAKWIDGGTASDDAAEGVLTTAFDLFRRGQYVANALRHGGVR